MTSSIWRKTMKYNLTLDFVSKMGSCISKWNKTVAQCHVYWISTRQQGISSYLERTKENMFILFSNFSCFSTCWLFNFLIEISLSSYDSKFFGVCLLGRVRLFGDRHTSWNFWWTHYDLWIAKRTQSRWSNHCDNSTSGFSFGCQ